jgi:hypothetical protein
MIFGRKARSGVDGAERLGTGPAAQSTAFYTHIAYLMFVYNVNVSQKVAKVYCKKVLFMI